MLQRLCVPALALLLLVAPLPLTHALITTPMHSHLLPAPRMSLSGYCTVPTDTVSSTAIVTPTDGLVVSATVPLAVSAPTDTIDSVAVCATYQNAAGASSGPTLVAILDSGAGTWSGSWDVSGLPEQSGVTLTFIAHYPSNQENLIGQRTVAIDRTAVVNTTPPVSTLTVAGNTYTANGTTYIAATTPIVLAATDAPTHVGSPGSTVTVYYQVDGGAVSVYSTPIYLAAYADGLHTISYWAVDGAGNVEAPHTATLFLDTTPPSITPLVAGLSPDGIAYYAPVTVAFAATDAGSKVQGITYSEGLKTFGYTPGSLITVNASTEIDYSAVDDVGNTVTGTLFITIAPPAATATVAASATPAPTHTATPTQTPTQTSTPRPSATPTATHTPTPTHTPTATHTPAPTRTPAPTPTWAPIDGPPLLNRTPGHSGTKSAGASVAPPPLTPLHVHRLPPAGPVRGEASCTRPCVHAGHGVTRHSRAVGARHKATYGYAGMHAMPIRTSGHRNRSVRGRRSWG